MDVPPAESDDRRLYSQASFFIYDALHFELARSVLKIASYEFASLKYFKVQSRLTLWRAIAVKSGYRDFLKNYL